MFHKYVNVHDSTKSLLTCIFYKKTKEEIIDDLVTKLSKTKGISDKFKRSKVEKSLMSLKSYIEKSQNAYGIYLVSSVELTKIELDLNYCKLWNIPEYFDYDDKFNTEYLTDLFCCDKYINAVSFEANAYTHYVGTKYKKRVLYQGNEFPSKLENAFLLYGNNVKPQGKFIKVIPKNLQWQEVYEEFQKIEMEKKIFRLSQVLLMINNPKESSKLLFKKEIEQAIEEYRVKELFVTKEEYNNYNLVDANFDIYILESLSKNDPVEILRRDYSSIIAVTYF